MMEVPSPAKDGQAVGSNKLIMGLFTGKEQAASPCITLAVWPSEFIPGNLIPSQNYLCGA